MSGSFESLRWNACVHRLDLGLYSHPKEFWGNGVRTHVNSKGKKSHRPEKFSLEEYRTHDAASSRTASPTHYQRAIPPLRGRLTFCPLRRVWQSKAVVTADRQMLHLLQRAYDSRETCLACCLVTYKLIGKNHCENIAQSQTKRRRERLSEGEGGRQTDRQTEK